jgi:hypothetical protein
MPSIWGVMSQYAILPSKLLSLYGLQTFMQGVTQLRIDSSDSFGASRTERRHPYLH